MTRQEEQEKVCRRVIERQTEMVRTELPGGVLPPGSTAADETMSRDRILSFCLCVCVCVCVMGALLA